METLEKKYQQVLEDLGGKANLLAVSKTHPVAVIEHLYNIGHRDFAENKVQELAEKSQKLKHLEHINWHFIGTLQSNKINKLLMIPNLKSIHSIDSLQLLEKILMKEPKKKIGLFLQVNTSDEVEKHGLKSIQDLLQGIGLIGKSSYFYFQGLMTIGAIRTMDFERSAHKSFKLLKDLQSQINEKLSSSMCELSMGMSGDYQIALEYGSDWVRVGSAIFGTRAS